MSGDASHPDPDVAGKVLGRERRCGSRISSSLAEGKMAEAIAEGGACVDASDPRFPPHEQDGGGSQYRRKKKGDAVDEEDEEDDEDEEPLDMDGTTHQRSAELIASHERHEHDHEREGPPGWPAHHQRHRRLSLQSAHLTGIRLAPTWWQLVALLQKNLRHRWRHPISAIMEVFVPLCFALFLLVYCVACMDHVPPIDYLRSDQGDINGNLYLQVFCTERTNETGSRPGFNGPLAGLPLCEEELPNATAIAMAAQRTWEESEKVFTGRHLSKSTWRFFNELLREIRHKASDPGSSPLESPSVEGVANVGLDRDGGGGNTTNTTDLLPAKYCASANASSPMLPVHGLCSLWGRVGFEAYLAFYLNAFEGHPIGIVSLNPIILAQWAAMVVLGRTVAETAITQFIGNNPTAPPYDRESRSTVYSAILNAGLLRFAPAENVPVHLISHLNQSSSLFRYVYGGIFDSVEAAQLEAANDTQPTWAILQLANFSLGFGVDIAMQETSLPSIMRPINPQFDGLYQSNRGDLYLASGFVYLQKELYTFYLEELKTTNFFHTSYASNHHPFLVHFSTLHVNANLVLKEAGSLVNFVAVMAFLYPFMQMVKSVALERELHIREASSIMGLRRLPMYLSYAFLHTLQGSVTVSIFALVILFGVARTSNYFILWLIFEIFYLSLIPLSALVAACFGSARFATQMAPVIYIMMSLGSLLFPGHGSESVWLYLLLSFFTPSALCFLLRDLNDLSSAAAHFRFNTLLLPLIRPRLIAVFLIFAADVVLYFLLMLYVDYVTPGNYGPAHHPLFFVVEPFRAFRRCLRGGRACADEGPREADAADDDAELFEPREPRTRRVVEMDGLVKVFERGGKAFRAVDDLRWSMHDCEISVLLGENGAGKSTSVNMLTGMEEMDAGDCRVDGFSVRRQLSAVRQRLGYCPQHNVLWPDLTCREHLEFFGKVKGLAGAVLETRVLEVLEMVDLVDKADALSSHLSGGQKRKLSVAIAFVGDNSLVILDEPTAGMDAAARRHTWQLLRLMSSQCAILLTTHFLDEADLLGDYIGIMQAGRLRCSGSSLYLKSKLGRGYTLTVELERGDPHDAIGAELRGPLQDVVTLSENAREKLYSVPKSSFRGMPAALRVLETRGTALGVRGFAVSATTLEEVFLTVLQSRNGVGGERDTAADPSRATAIGVSAHPPSWWAAPCEPSRWVQLRAMFVKRWCWALRDGSFHLVTMLSPMVVMVCGFLLSVMKPTSTTTVDFSVALYEMKTALPFAEDCIKLLGWASEWDRTVPPVLHVDSNTKTFPEMADYLSRTYYSHEDLRYSAIQCRNGTTWGDGSKLYGLFYNSSSTPSVVLTVAQFFHQVVMTGLMNAGASVEFASRVPFELSSSLLPSNPYSQPPITKSSTSAVMTAIILVIPFTFLPAMPAGWVVKERECKARHMQRLAGLSNAVYWLGNFLFDMLWYVVAELLGVLIVVLFVISGHEIGVSVGPLMVTMFLYGMSSTMMAYVMSLLFGKGCTSAAVHQMVGLWSYFGGFLLLMIIGIGEVVVEKGSWLQSVRFFFWLVPSFSMGDAVVQLLSVDPKRIPDPSPWSMGVIGWPCIYMAAEIPVWAILLWLLEHDRRPVFFLRLQLWWLRCCCPMLHRRLGGGGGGSTEDAAERESEEDPVACRPLSPLAFHLGNLVSSSPTHTQQHPAEANTGSAARYIVDLGNDKLDRYQERQERGRRPHRRYRDDWGEEVRNTVDGRQVPSAGGGGGWATIPHALQGNQLTASFYESSTQRGVLHRYTKQRDRRQRHLRHRRQPSEGGRSASGGGRVIRDWSFETNSRRLSSSSYETSLHSAASWHPVVDSPENNTRFDGPSSSSPPPASPPAAAAVQSPRSAIDRNKYKPRSKEGGQAAPHNTQTTPSSSDLGGGVPHTVGLSDVALLRDGPPLPFTTNGSCAPYGGLTRTALKGALLRSPVSSSSSHSQHVVQEHSPQSTLTHSGHTIVTPTQGQPPQQGQGGAGERAEGKAREGGGEALGITTPTPGSQVMTSASAVLSPIPPGLPLFAAASSSGSIPLQQQPIPSSRVLIHNGAGPTSSPTPPSISLVSARPTSHATATSAHLSSPSHPQQLPSPRSPVPGENNIHSSFTATRTSASSHSSLTHHTTTHLHSGQTWTLPSAHRVPTALLSSPLTTSASKLVGFSPATVRSNASAQQHHRPTHHRLSRDTASLGGGGGGGGGAQRGPSRALSPYAYAPLPGVRSAAHHLPGLPAPYAELLRPLPFSDRSRTSTRSRDTASNHHKNDDSAFRPPPSSLHHHLSTPHAGHHPQGGLVRSRHGELLRLNGVDSDVEEERQAVRQDVVLRLRQDPVQVVNARKVYASGVVAVRSLSFSVMRGEVFALLGTNGSGKTTTMSMLCQEQAPTRGKMFVDGHNTVRESVAARQRIGYCPQFDATLDLLTVEEHLQLYADIHGVIPQQRSDVVERLLVVCGLMPFRDVLSKDLSGGNRRKLSVAVCLIGGPSVVCLDEPSAGMDPMARRKLWESILTIAKECSVLLTTHHMEEVEALANCVGIMSRGTLRCLGDLHHLKRKYGSGYEVSLRVNRAGRQDTWGTAEDEVEEFVACAFPGSVINECFRGERYVLSLPAEGTVLSTVFQVLQENQEPLGITDFIVSQTTIEQVFLRFCGTCSEEELNGSMAVLPIPAVTGTHALQQERQHVAERRRCA